MLKVKDLIGLADEGPVGLNRLRVAVFTDVDSGLYHLDKYTDCAENLVKDKQGYSQSQLLGVGDSLKNMCERCLENIHLGVYDEEEDTYLYDISIHGLHYIIGNHHEFHDWHSDVPTMDAFDVYRTMAKIFTPGKDSYFPELYELESDAELIFNGMPCFKYREKAFKHEITLLRERLKEIDATPLTEYYAQRAIRQDKTSFVGRPEVKAALDKVIKEEVLNYVKDTKVFLAPLKTNIWNPSMVVEVLHRHESGKFCILSSAAIDYLLRECTSSLLGVVKLDSMPSDAVLENLAALYEPETASSLLSDFKVAYTAAISV